MLLYALGTSAQDTEFTIHENGLIYDEQTMSRLGRIVDSLNLRFKTCEPKEYHSLAQGFGTKVVLKDNLQQARQAINNNMPLAGFLEQFPDADVRREWIVKFRYTDYRDKKVIEYSGLPLREDTRIKVRVADRHNNDKSNGWILDDENDNLVALYLEGVRPQSLPGQYAQLIQYVDCMIDTTAQIYLTKRKNREPRPLPPDSKIKQYLRLANDFKGEPKMPDIDWDSPFAETRYHKYVREYQQWNNARLGRLDENMRRDHYHTLLMEAMEEALESEVSDAELEFYVERYLSPAQALKMKRLRQPVGNCSMDRTPRLHAQSICRLAAKTTQWDIFLRAHLDIMNDNFERRSDGSYAWAGRGTYLRELEELHINAPDLLIGTALRASDVSGNHYIGDIGRVGRALSESSGKQELEDRILSMVQDEQLDLYNRLLMAYLFGNYNHYLQDETLKKENAARLLKAVATLPEAVRKVFEK